MSTASRNRGMAGGTCGGGITQPSVPGAEGGTRGHYDPRAFSGKSGHSWGMLRKCLPRATNAAPPRKRAAAGLQALRLTKGATPAPSASPAYRAHRAIFPIGLRERPSRHSLPPPTWLARGEPPRGRPPP